eukprot:9085533-Pyramimonas_sp.AAC.1
MGDSAQDASIVYRCPPAGVQSASQHLYVANTGPAVGVSLESVQCALGQFGEVERVVCPDHTKPKIFLTFKNVDSAVAAHAWIEGG